MINCINLMSNCDSINSINKKNNSNNNIKKNILVYNNHVSLNEFIENLQNDMFNKPNKQFMIELDTIVEEDGDNEVVVEANDDNVVK